MTVSVKSFDELTTDELYEIMRLRQDVFVVEQNCPYCDLDGIDRAATHVFIMENGEAVAYLRFFPKHGEDGVVHIGRVVSRCRGRGLGGLILREGLRAAREQYAPRELYIEAQTYAAPFYAREGFVITSEEFLEDGIPHVEMRLKIQ